MFSIRGGCRFGQQNKPHAMSWYQGTADAVRKQLNEVESPGVPYVLILAGDHLYRMDYGAMIEFHWKKEG